MKKILGLLVILSIFSCKETKKDNDIDLVKGNWKLVSIYSKEKHSPGSISIANIDKIIKYSNDTLYYQYDSLTSDTAKHIRDTIIYNLQLSIGEIVNVYYNLESIITGETKKGSYSGSYYEDEHTTNSQLEKPFPCITFDIGNDSCYVKGYLYTKYDNLGKDTLKLEYIIWRAPDDMIGDDINASYIFVKSSDK